MNSVHPPLATTFIPTGENQDNPQVCEGQEKKLAAVQAL